MSRHAWMVGPAGEAVYLQYPSRTPIRIETIAHTLSNVCRWAGHCTPFYSVASHSIHVSRLLAKTHGIVGARVGLLHDAHEAYVGDMPTPMKVVIGDTWRALETAWERRVREHFKLPKNPDEIWAACHHADLVALSTERAQIIPPHEVPDDLTWPDLPPPDLTWACEENGGWEFLDYARRIGLVPRGAS